MIPQFGHDNGFLLNCFKIIMGIIQNLDCHIRVMPLSFKNISIGTSSKFGSHLDFLNLNNTITNRSGSIHIIRTVRIIIENFCFSLLNKEKEVEKLAIRSKIKKRIMKNIIRMKIVSTGIIKIKINKKR